MAESSLVAASRRQQLRPIPPNESFTFAVIGDNRGDSDGNPPPVLLDIIAAINSDAPAFVVSTGDLINAYPEEDESHLRKLWCGYLSAVKRIAAPVFHVPGNHDLFHELSARLWAELLGPTYYAFDHGRSRVIGLDSETQPSRVVGAQFDWLRDQLQSAGDRRIFLFVHQPLFPVDGHVGNSLDIFREDRDRLHALFVAHRHAIEGVFHGHEHLFSLEERDGVRYYISAGSGSPLYVPREIGGVYHYLLVRVTADDCTVELKKMWTSRDDAQPVRTIRPGEVLESWEQATIWNFWDQTMMQQRVTEPTKTGGGALRLDFNLAHYEWPSLITEFTPPMDFRDVARVTADIFLADEGTSELTVKAAFHNGCQSESPDLTLSRGWNKLDVSLDDAWMTPAIRRSVRKFEITFTGRTTDRVRSVVVDDIRFERARSERLAASANGSDVFESWDKPLLWGTWDETTHPASDISHPVDGHKALKLHFDFAKYKRPRLYAELRPAWDLSAIRELTFDVFVPDHSPSLALHFALTGGLETCEGPSSELRCGKNHVALNFSWLKSKVRAKVERLECWISSDASATTGSVSFGQIMAGKPQP